MPRWQKNEDGSYRDLDQHVPIEEIRDWQCKMYVYSNYLYYQLDTPLLSDDDYDSLVRYLARTYENLPEWFTSRISQDELKTGAYALSLTDQEKEQALQWVERVTQYKTRNS